MKKVIISVLVVCLLAFTCSAFGDDLIAEILPSEIEVYYGETKLEVPTYSDGTTVYVPLETLMQMLGGSYEARDGKATIIIKPDFLPSVNTPVSADTPSLSWEYIDYYLLNNWGINAEQWKSAFLERHNVEAKVNKAIEMGVDLNSLLRAIDDTCARGLSATPLLDELIK